MREIPLTKGKVALVDDDLYPELSKRKWQVEYAKGLWYATRTVEKKKVWMHRVIAGTPAGMVTDHINGDGLDNRRANLRICTQAENNRNRGRRHSSSWSHKGIWREPGGWRAAITLNKKLHRLGLFSTKDDAIEAYNTAALKYHGEFAKLNPTADQS